MTSIRFLTGVILVNIVARQPKILYANRKDIRILQVGTRNETNVLGVDDVAVVDFDWQSKSLFYSEVNNKEILRFYWKTSQSPTKVISTGLESPDGLAVDWVTKKLYWTDAETNRIELANLDGSHRKVLVWQDLDQPRALALLPQRGYV